MEQILLEAISKDIKDGKVLGNSQSGFARGSDQPAMRRLAVRQGESRNYCLL